MAIEAKHRAVVRSETVVSMAINSLIPSTIIWMLDVAPPQSLLGENPIVEDMIPASGLATFMMTLMLTIIIRKRVRSGALPALDWPKHERGALRLIPRLLVPRAISLALVAMVLFVPIGLIVVGAMHILPLSKGGFLVFNLIFGATVGLSMARLVVLPALADATPSQGSAA